MAFYAVKIGRVPGIYDTWDECLEQTKGYSGATYKKFKTREEAAKYCSVVEFYNESIIVQHTARGCSMPIINESAFPDAINENSISYLQSRLNNPPIPSSQYEIYVDGSYNSVTSVVGYGLVLLCNGEVVIRDMGASHAGEDTSSRNVLGEIKGAIKALDLAVANGIKEITIYYDYEGIEKWINGSWKAKNELTKNYVETFKQRSRFIDVSFVKIKSHTNNKWNDEADRLAKMGAGLL